MIELRKGDMLESATSGFLIHGCNCQGAMGSGIARSIRAKWPKVYTRYHTVSENEGLKLGTVQPVNIDGDIVVVNAMTQEFYAGHPSAKGKSRFVSYDAVVECFEAINSLRLVFPDIEPVIHFPLLGAGLAAGDWDIIEKIIDKSVPDMEKVLWVL